MKVLKKRCDRLIDRFGILLVPCFQACVLIPSVVTDVRASQLDESNSAFDQASGHEAFACEDLRRPELVVQTIHRLCRGGLLRNIANLRNGGLHFECQFVVGDRRLDRIVLTEPLDGLAIELTEQLELMLLQLRGGFQGPNVRKTVSAGAQHGSLEGRWQKTVAEAIQTTGWDESSIEYDITGQILALGA